MEKTLSTEQLFSIKQKFLQHIPHPKLIKKQMDRLARSEDIDMTDDLSVEQQITALNLLDYLKLYDKSVLQLKLQIANARESIDLYRSLYNLLQLQNNLIDTLAGYLTDCPYEEEGIKQSDPFDTHAMAKEIEGKELKESEIKPYLCKQFSNEQVSDYSVLGTAVIRAKKIKENA